MTKTCSRCRTAKPVSEFGPHPKTKDGFQSWCRQCVREYNRTRYHEKGGRERLAARYRANAEELKARRRAHYAEHREEQLAKSRAQARALKARVIETYGGSCACCGEVEEAFLTIDHPNGDGRKHRTVTGAGSAFYQWLRREGFPEGYVVLCFNCNCGRQVNGGVCPHQG